MPDMIPSGSISLFYLGCKVDKRDCKG